MLAMKSRKRVVQGGTSSGKTYGIIPILIDEAIKRPRITITVVAESIPAVRDGAVKIFQDVMVETGRWFESRWLGNPMQYKFANGSKIQFKSFDTFGKAKAAGKRDILFLNEANHIPFEIADALMIRSKETWIDFNPDAEFWAHTEVLKDHNAEFLLLTYKDNEGLPPETLEDLLIKVEKAKTSEYWKNWCKVYIDGEIGQLQDTIFQFTTCENIPKDAEFIGYGLDWGFTNDPTALVEMRRYDSKLYLNELIYERKMTNSDIVSRLLSLGISKSAVIIADSSEPKSIEDLQRAGFNNIEGAVKGPDSVRNGIDKLHAETIVVTNNSHNLIRELRSYSWDKDRSGRLLGRPVDFNNHAIDAVRYISLNLLNRKPEYVIL